MVGKAVLAPALRRVAVNAAGQATLPDLPIYLA
jgi:hypothetical protein